MVNVMDGDSAFNDKYIDVLDQITEFLCASRQPVTAEWSLSHAAAHSEPTRDAVGEDGQESVHVADGFHISHSTVEH